MRSELDWYIELAEAENVSSAADRLHISQPTLSRMLARLERELGTQLFDRNGRRLSLNDKGRLYLTHCRRARMELDVARASIAEMLDPVQGVVRLSFLHSFGVKLVPELIGAFRTSARVGFTLHQDAAEGVVGRVLNDDADIGLVSPRPQSIDVVWEPLLHQQLGLAVPIDHRLAGRAEVSIDEVSGEQFVAMKHGYGMRRILEELAANADFRPEITFEATELATVAGLVGAGLGVAVMPIGGDTQMPVSVQLIPVDGAQTTREIGLVWRRDRALATSAARFRDFVVAHRDQW